MQGQLLTVLSIVILSGSFADANYDAWDYKLTVRRSLK